MCACNLLACPCVYARSVSTLRVCVSHWWQTAEVLFLKEYDNLSSENLSQPSSTFSAQPAQTGQQSKPMYDNDPTMLSCI